MTMIDGDITMNDHENKEGISTEEPNSWESLSFKMDESVGPDADLLAPELPDTDDDEEYDEPAADLLKKDRRKPNSVKYERKVRNMFKFALTVTLDPTKETRMADSAAILMYAPEISESLGDLAASDRRIARAIDFLADDAVGNPALAFTMATLPFVLQIMRNHEQDNIVEISPYREMKIPFTKRTIKLKIKFPKLRGFARNTTVPPDRLNAYVYTKPEIQAMLKERGIDINAR